MSRKLECGLLVTLILTALLPVAALTAGRPDQKLTDSPQIQQDFTKGPTVKVVVNLTPRLTVSANTDFASPTSIGTLQTRIRNVQQSVLDATLGSDVRLRFRFDNIAAFSAEVTEEGLAALQANPDVVSIEPVFIIEAHLAQGIPLMHGSTYRSSYNGAGVAIAICDTGIDYTHARLGGGGFPNGKVIGGVRFWGRRFRSHSERPGPRYELRGHCGGRPWNGGRLHRRRGLQREALCPENLVWHDRQRQ